MPRLCILTQYFPPELGAPQGRLSELGERLVDLGWQVEALTALPNYPTGSVFDGYAPLRPVVEHVGRIRTARVPLYASQQGFVKRLACYFSFAASAAALGPRLCARPDLLWVESPPLFIGIAARTLARRWRSTRWSIAVFMNIARIIGAGPLMVIDTEVAGAHRSKPEYRRFMSSSVAIETPELPMRP